MSIFDRLKGKKEETAAADTSKKSEKAADKKEAAQKATAAQTVAPKTSRVLLRPIVTEKATVTGTYIFAVNPTTNKQEIKKEVKRVYGVTPKSVRVMNVRGKKIRWNYVNGQRQDWKKAIVRLNAGETINVYEGT